MALQAIDEGIRAREGLVHPDVFSDPAIYQQEMDRIFRHCWLYVGHESSIPHPGDYLVNYMGEEEVIVLRDQAGKVRVMANTCPHRGNKVCLFDRGNQKTFTCTFHGWQFDLDGSVRGLPFGQVAYRDDLDRKAWGLTEIPRVASYGGLLFANWDRAAVSLEDYLGEVRWYLDRLLLKAFVGGIEILPGRQAYFMPSNWKLLADSFMGDEVHVPITHVSFFKALMESGGKFRAASDIFRSGVQVLARGSQGVPHNVGVLEFFDDPRPFASSQMQPALDQEIAQDIGPEAVEWLADRNRRWAEFMAHEKPKAYGSANWTIFPNLSLIFSPSVFYGTGLIQWHPRGPMMIEAWQWCAVEKDAPDSVKRVCMRHMASDQAAAGMIATDDTENFERSTDLLSASTPKPRPFHYAMPGMPREALLREFAEAGIDLEAVPGKAVPMFTEETIRAYYGFYQQCMQGSGPDAAATKGDYAL